MELGEIISYAATALGGGGIAGIFGWRLSKRRQTAEVKQAEIEVVRKTMEEVYKPIIDSLNSRVQEMEAELKELRGEVKRLREERDECRKHLAEMRVTLDRLTGNRGAADAPRAARTRNPKTGRYERGS